LNSPKLNEHSFGHTLAALRREPRRVICARLIHWIVFWNHGGAYTTDWMRDALLDNIKRKIAKYAMQNKSKLEQQLLAEFFLLAYYDEAVLHNTPYDAPGFGF
jgi:hypothetical protein